MRPLLSYIATLAVIGAAFSLIHWGSLAFGLPDLVALMLYAIPVIAYIAYCTENENRRKLRAGVVIYVGFAGTLLGCVGLVYFIG